MSPPKISVVVPSYNKVKYIGKTLKSIFDQKYGDLEVIVQDGGSTDGTVEVIKKLAKKLPIKWESKKDKGQLDAINKGLRKASGEILTYINADDCYIDGAFEKVAESYIKQPNSFWCAGQGIIVNKKGKEIAGWVSVYKNLLLKINSRFFLLANNYLMQPSVFFDKDIYRKYGPFTGTQDFVTEYELWLKFSKSRMPFVISKNLSKFRIEPGTKTKRLFKDLLNEDWKIVKKHTKNPIILTLHYLNNMGRVIVGSFV